MVKDATPKKVMALAFENIQEMIELKKTKRS